MDNGNKDCVPEALSKSADDDSGGKRVFFPFCSVRYTNMCVYTSSLLPYVLFDVFLCLIG